MCSCRNRFALALVASSCFTGVAAAQFAKTTRVSVGPGGLESDGWTTTANMSPNGRFVTFTSYATNLLPINGPQGQAFVLDRQTQQLELISQRTNGVAGNQVSYVWSVSDDGRYIAFQSTATNLVPGDTNGTHDVFVRDRVAGTTTRVSVDSSGVQADSYSVRPSLSDDGLKIAFLSGASNLVAGDTNGVADVFVKDLVSGQVQRINLTPAGSQANLDSFWASASSDMQWVAYASNATNLVVGDTNGVTDVFVTNTLSGATQRVSVSSSGVQCDAACGYASTISRDGSVVVFSSLGTTLVSGDTNNQPDVFVHEIASGFTERVSLRDGGLQIAGESVSPQVSSDGRFVAYMSLDANILPGDDNGDYDVFVFDRLARRVACASLGWTGEFVEAGGQYYYHLLSSISADGRYVLFSSDGASIVQNDTNHLSDAFVRDWLASTGPVAFCPAVASAGSCTPQIAADANPSATFATPCQLSVGQLDAQRSGLFFYGIDNSGFAPLAWLGGPSWLCVRAPSQRTPVQVSGGTAGQCDGVLQLDWNQFQQAHAGALGNPWLMGQHIYVQAWFRDPASSATTALTSALELTAQP